MLLSCPHGQVSVCILLLEVWKQRLRDYVSRSSSHTCWDGIAHTVFCWGCCCLQNRKIITDSAGLCGLPCLPARHKQFRSLYAPKWIHSENKVRFFLHDKVLVFKGFTYLKRSVTETLFWLSAFEGTQNLLHQSSEVKKTQVFLETIMENPSQRSESISLWKQ